METLQLIAEWDKTFPQSDKVLHTKITFHNRYGIPLAGDLYRPKRGQRKAGCHRGVRPLRRCRKSRPPASMPKPWRNGAF